VEALSDKEVGDSNNKHLLNRRLFSTGVNSVKVSFNDATFKGVLMLSSVIFPEMLDESNESSPNKASFVLSVFCEIILALDELIFFSSSVLLRRIQRWRLRVKF